MENNLRYRQIHMDFHTSPHIPNVGADFDAEEFSNTLYEADVNSVTLFARCHHGMMYYDSEKFPELIHPHLENKNLLKEQIEACNEKNIRTPIYTTVQWDHYLASKHPEWLARDPKGAPVFNNGMHGEEKKNDKTHSLYEPGFYRFLCVNTGYRDFLKEHTLEILNNFKVDGLFFDIVMPIDCSCDVCQTKMKELDKNPANAQDRIIYGQNMINEFKKDMTEFVHKHNKDCSVFYNRGHIGPAHREAIDAYTHLEIESLPGGEWSYLHYPISARYARTLNKDNLGMTGKFHTMWGDFHSFKNKAALEYECFRMLALNSKVMVGDQLEPSGKISKPVYDLIGEVYSKIKEKEPWCNNAEPVTEIGVLSSEEFLSVHSQDLPKEMLGVTSLLQECGYQFDIIDSKSDFSSYRLLILPDNISTNKDLAKKIDDFVDNGGSLLASYKSGLDVTGSQFNLASLGVKYKGNAPYSPDFLMPEGKIGEGLPKTEHVMYQQGLEVESVSSSVLVDTYIPYFNRTWEHFISHNHTPSSGEIGYPGILQNKNSIYFMHPIFGQYGENAPAWCKKLVDNAIKLIMPNRIIEHNGPSTLEVSINKQDEEKRWILHTLHYLPQRRALELDTIEDVIPLYNVKVNINIPNKVQNVTLVPSGEQLDFKINGSKISFEIPYIEGHQMINIEYA